MANISLKNIYGYLQKTGMADQIHIRKDEIVVYYWNQSMTNLIPSISIHAGRIEQIYHPRSIVPKLYLAINYEIVNDLDGSEGYVRDMRNDKRE